MKPVVVIIGRPNVGKSALFNRLVQKRVSIVEDIPGVTRDRITAETDWSGRAFVLIDTGGLLVGGPTEMAEQIGRQVELALAEADVVLFVIDAKDGVLPGDTDVAGVIRRSRKPVILVVNKAEERRANTVDPAVYHLGLGDPVMVSSLHGTGTGDLLDRVIEALPGGEADDEPEGRVRVAIVGRPNVGKSSLLNGIIGEERMIVSSVPGTTRDAVDVPYDSGEKRFLFIDTAGMRRRSKIGEPVEKYSVARALKAVDRADVAIVVLDAGQGITDQDKKIAGYADERGKGMVLCFNKWDLAVAQGEGKNREGEFIELARWQLGFVSYAPVVFTTATTGRGLLRLVDRAWDASNQHSRRIPTGQLNEVIREAFLLSAAPSEKGKDLKLFYATQTGTRPPVFLLFVNEPHLAKEPYVRYLERRLRESFGFEGTPLVIKFRRRT